MESDSSCRKMSDMHSFGKYANNDAIACLHRTDMLNYCSSFLCCWAMLTKHSVGPQKWLETFNLKLKSQSKTVLQRGCSGFPLECCVCVTTHCWSILGTLQLDNSSLEESV